MSRANNRSKALAFFLVLFLSLPGVAKAAVHIQTDTPRVSKGDTVEVMILVSGEGMALAEGVFTYDPAVLTYVESEGGASDGLLYLVSAQKGGVDTLSARVRFAASGAGSTHIEVALERVLGYDGKTQENTKASVAVEVTAPQVAPTPTPRPLDYAAKGVAASNVAGAEEPMYIWRSLENVTVPSRYSVVKSTYQGETVEAARVADSDAPTLVYLSNASGDVGGYYIWEETTATLYPYQTISSVSKSYILLMPDGSVPLPDGFVETTLLVGEKEYPAFFMEEDDIYLLYARNPGGEVGYYMYNPQDESLQRYVVLPARPAPPAAPSAAPVETAPTIAPAQLPTQPPAQTGDAQTGNGAFYTVSAIAVLLAAAAAVLLVLYLKEKKRRKPDSDLPFA